jgi:hypothetical protein
MTRNVTVNRTTVCRTNIIHTHSYFARNPYYYRSSPSYFWNGYSYAPYFHYNVLLGYWWFAFYNHDTGTTEIIRASSRYQLHQLVYGMRDSW